MAGKKKRRSGVLPIATAGAAGTLWGLLQWLLPMTPAIRLSGWIGVGVVAVVLLWTLNYRWFSNARKSAASVVVVGIVGGVAFVMWPMAAIAISEYYPRYEWPLTESLPDSGNKTMPIDGRVLVAAFDARRDDYRLTPLLYNTHSLTLLCEPIIWIGFPNVAEAERVRVRPSQYWSPVISDRWLWYYANDRNDFGCVQPGDGTGAEESLFLGFPSAGEYPVAYQLKGTREGQPAQKTGRFTLIVREVKP